MTKMYPFISGPRQLNWLEWIIILGANALAYCCLIFPNFISLPEKIIFNYEHPLIPAALFQIIIIFLFLFIQILALRLITGHEWKQLFHRPSLKELELALAFLGLTYAISVITGTVANALFGSVSGNAATGLNLKTPHAWLIFLYERFSSAIQIMGEEFLTIMPFLAITSAAKHFHLPKATWWGNLISALIFSLLHLSTYDYKLGYVILGLTFTRIGLTSAYQKTRNMWISFLVHYCFDTLAFLILFITS